MFFLFISYIFNLVFLLISQSIDRHTVIIFNIMRNLLFSAKERDYFFGEIILI